VSRVIATLKDTLEAWRTRSVADLDVISVYLDGFALRVRSAGKVISVPVLGVVGVLPDGHKHLLALELCGGESIAAWRGGLDDLVARGLRAPIVYAANADAARAAYAVFERAWTKRCPRVVTSLREGGDELLTFFTFPNTQWKALRSTNVIERLHEEFRRRVKTQPSLPSEDAALLLLFSLVVSGQIKLRRIDGWRNIAAVVSSAPVAGGGGGV
jgi:putative transposase